MTEFKITIGLPKEDHHDLRQKAENFFHNNTMKIQREFFESCTTSELETLFLHQQEKETSLTMIKRILTERYMIELSDQKKYLYTVEQFLLAHYSMVDTEGKLAQFKQSELAKHFSKKTLMELTDIYLNLLHEFDLEERESLTTKSMTKIILEKLDENTPVYILKKLLDANVENVELENFIKEKFQLVRA